MMRKLTLSVVLLGALAAGSVQVASAADLPVKAPPPVVVSSWTGLYIGGELGAQWGDATWNTTCLGATGVFCSPNGQPIPGNPFFVDASSPHTFHPLAARLGAYVGYNWQFAPNWLVGVEGDIAFAWKDGNKESVVGVVGCGVFCGFRLPTTGPGIDRSTVHMQWDSALRARLGYLATPDLLLYVAGGAAFQAVGMNVSCTIAGNWCVATRSVTNSDILPGWTVGGGLEYKYMNSWILRGEYRYSEFNRFNTSFFQPSPDDVHANTKWRTHIATFGISYLFNAGPAVVAKY
jgi:outer membrane immunogenic protein